ncbi:hypothetical protein [Anaerosporobacter faecicola]|uniref:hypothetical protein n=1 Tax=Anaerosporobacter faecicola TaxID=2718714 RepID=UPI00143ACD4F|nr:hypothetical protein [Anaerosporobacter faecicola]
MNTFIIKDILVKENRIDYEYVIEGEWKKYFSTKAEFWVEYSEDIEDMPKALAAVPLVSNVIVLASIFNAKIQVPCLDKDFYESINAFMAGFANMYPVIPFKYQDVIYCDCIVDTKSNNRKNDDNNALLYFSGGVDAYTSLIRHEQENLILFTVCGADIAYNNEQGFLNIFEKNLQIAKKHNMDIVSCVSTLREFINEKEIYDYIFPLINDNFWHAFQHGLGMFGLAAGMVHCFDLKKLYFASSFCDKDEDYTCGSDPTIDNYVHIGSSVVCHDGYDLSRQDKIASLCRYRNEKNKKLELRVCYSSSKGENCCKCEKCVRTMLGILVNGGNPNEFGFAYDRDTIYKNLVKALLVYSESPQIAYTIYNEIFEKLKLMYSYEDFPDEIKVFYNSDFYDVMRMLDVIRLQMVEEMKMYEKTDENDIGSLLYKDYVEMDAKTHKRFIKQINQSSEIRPAQNTGYWIGNGGFMIDSNGDVNVQSSTIIITRKKLSIIIEGWAADFMNGSPLALLTVKLNNKIYSANYGGENNNLAKHFGNAAYRNIVYDIVLPFKELEKAKKISFCMYSYDGDQLICYPDIEYAIVVKKECH